MSDTNDIWADLLAACEAALSYIEEELEHQADIYARVDRDTVIVRKKLIAAIAKAKNVASILGVSED